MTIRTKRRRSRSLAAILAAMLMASVLSVVAGGPAQAANTSGEHLIDTNGDKVPDSRQFAGSHRYLTAQYLADAYATNAGSPSTVIIASGESMVDAVTASGLAGNLDAPILLTRTDRLPHNVARYIDGHNVSHVVIVGGTAAVSDAVQTAIEALGSGPTTERVSGADRYGTAAAIGGRLGGPNPTWCGSEQTAAILVNGGDSGRADAIAIGPLAFGLGLPVLLTAADELPQSTADFLTDNAVEHVVIVGGTGAVSESIRDAMIEDVGVISVRRISGGDAAGTSVEIAEEMLGKCADVIGATPDMVALVNRDATADGVAAGPAMGYGLGNGPIPVLLVSDELPAAVSDYLASTDEVRGGLKTNLSIVAIGGTAVVSNNVMAAAVAAAKTSPALTASISFNEKVPNRFSVTYSDDVKLPVGADDGIDYAGLEANELDGTVLDPTLYRINARRVEAQPDDADPQGTGPEQDSIANQIYVEDRTVTIVLSHNLAAGDVVSVVGGAKLGANDDLRPLEAASITISRSTPAADRSAPVIKIIAVAGESTFDVIVREPNLLTEVDGATYMADGGVKVRGSGVVLTDQPADFVVGRPGAGMMRYRFSLPDDDTETADVNESELSKGDVVEVSRNTFLDKGNRGNRLTRLTVQDPEPVDEFEIDTVSIGDATPQTSASATISTDMSVTAKGDGVAAGIAGNGWRIYGYADPSADATKKADIDVDVDTVHKIITYTINNGAPTQFDLARAFVANETFAANFTVDYADRTTLADKTTPVTATDPAGVGFEGGSSQVAVRVVFNDYVDALGADNALAAAIAGVTTLPIAQADENDDTVTTCAEDTPLCVQVMFQTPDNEVHITYTAITTGTPAVTGVLPVRGGTRVIPEGVATNFFASDPVVEGEDNSKAEVLRGLRPDSSLTPFGPPSSN
ncbi:cell wall-binding repeat-containing protein [Candidatus Poriferisodalis sp.]|uniref:cell wall-binding repeat-containing protein n=1 Tax=Candidatus Poriferisodalis sp. TaxID=3101277 RepID=UPI003B027C44